jgi:transcriptional regulator with XRE-family HTH domain
MGGDLIREARKRAGLTQRELAERAGTTQSSIARWEAHRSEPSYATVHRLVGLCGFALVPTLHPYEDGIRDDLHQAHQILAMSPTQRLRQIEDLNDFVQEGRRAMVRAQSA